MPDMSDRRVQDAWENMQRRADFVDIEDALLGVMAEAQAAGQLPEPGPVVSPEPAPAIESAPEPEEEPEDDDEPLELDLSGLKQAIASGAAPGSLTPEGALADMESIAEFLDVTMAVNGDTFAVFGVQLDKAHVVALFATYNIYQLNGNDESLIALIAFVDALVDGLYQAMQEGA